MDKVYIQQAAEDYANTLDFIPSEYDEPSEIRGFCIEDFKAGVSYIMSKLEERGISL